MGRFAVAADLVVSVVNLFSANATPVKSHPRLGRILLEVTGEHDLVLVFDMALESGDCVVGILVAQLADEQGVCPRTGLNRVWPFSQTRPLQQPFSLFAQRSDQPVLCSSGFIRRRCFLMRRRGTKQNF